MASIAGAAFAVDIGAAAAASDARKTSRTSATDCRAGIALCAWRPRRRSQARTPLRATNSCTRLYREVFYQRAGAGPAREAASPCRRGIGGAALERLSDVAPDLADHFEESADWPRAISTCALRADRAGRRYAHREATRLAPAEPWAWRADCPTRTARRQRRKFRRKIGHDPCANPAPRLSQRGEIDLRQRSDFDKQTRACASCTPSGQRPESIKVSVSARPVAAVVAPEMEGGVGAEPPAALGSVTTPGAGISKEALELGRGEDDRPGGSAVRSTAASGSARDVGRLLRYSEIVSCPRGVWKETSTTYRSVSGACIASVRPDLDLLKAPLNLESCADFATALGCRAAARPYRMSTRRSARRSPG